MVRLGAVEILRPANPVELLRARIPGLQFADDEILQRCIYPMINEGAKILAEGKAQRASDIDIVWINGYGWPVYRGGPMFYADLIGPDEVLAKLREFEATMGEDFKPAPLLQSVVAEKKRFQDL